MSSVVIEARQLTKVYNHQTVVNHIDMSVNRGEIYGFLGPNGSGKTTTMRMLCGLLVPDGGGGTCLGYDIIKDAYQIKCHVGYMCQHFSLYKDLNAYENLQFMARAYNLSISKKQLKEILLPFNFNDKMARRLAGSLSGGWQQRLALAAVMLHKPQLLLLDEPTAGVDPQARGEFWDQINRFASEGMTILVSTHYMDEAERCNRLTYIAFGDILAMGTVDEVIQKAGLKAYRAKGSSLMSLKNSIGKEYPDVLTMIFGNEIHIAAQDESMLKRVVQQHSGNYSWEMADPSLEDVFIYLVGRAQGGQ